MRTLNEVIKAWEICESDIGLCKDCSYLNDCNKNVVEGHKLLNKDILYYLKQLKEITDILDNI